MSSDNSARKIFSEEISKAYDFFGVDQEREGNSPIEVVAGLSQTSRDDVELAQALAQYGAGMRKLIKTSEIMHGLECYQEWGTIPGNKEFLAKRLAYQVLTLSHTRVDSTPARLQHWFPVCVIKKFSNNESSATRNCRITETVVDGEGETYSTLVKSNRFAHSSRDYPDGFYEDDLERLFSKYESDFAEATHELARDLSYVNSIAALVGLQTIRNPRRQGEFSGRLLGEVVEMFIDNLDQYSEVYYTVGRTTRRMPLTPYSPQVQILMQDGRRYLVQAYSPKRALIAGNSPVTNREADSILYRARSAIIRRAKITGEPLYGF